MSSPRVHRRAYLLVRSHGGITIELRSYHGVRLRRIHNIIRDAHARSTTQANILLRFIVKGRLPDPGRPGILEKECDALVPLLESVNVRWTSFIAGKTFKHYDSVLPLAYSAVFDDQ